MSTERAFLSMADKTTLPEFAQNLDRFYTLLSCGDTAQVITDAGVRLGSLRETLSLTMNLASREQVAAAIASHIRRFDTAKPIGLVCIGIEPLSASAALADFDRSGPLMIMAALDSKKPVLSRSDQLPEAIERMEAGVFDDRVYRSGLEAAAMEIIAPFAGRMMTQWAAAKT